MKNMTRINSNIHPRSLTDEHLLAEHREIKRICSVFDEYKGELSKLPNRFCLGTGHVLFFVNKPSITYLRYVEIHKECLNRGFNVQPYHQNWDVYKTKFNANKEPIYLFTKMDSKLNVDRIVHNLRTGKKATYHYYGKPISIEEAVDKIKNCETLYF